jgi:lysophospholipase L1-like esterase
MNLVRRVLSRATLLLVGTIVALALLEVGLRVTGWFLVRSRAPARLAAGPSPGVIRILCLGESTTFGAGRSSEDSYPAQLERILNERAGRHRYTVFNAGLPATTTDRIVADLEKTLDGYRPDIVVTMMGINDGPNDDPMFPVSDTLRVVKLGRLLAASIPHAFGADERPPATQIAPTPRENGMTVSGIPPEPSLILFFAAANLIAGRLDDAERAVTPLAETPADREAARATATKAEGELVMVYAQRTRMDEMERHHRRYRELTARPNPATATNYRTLARAVAARGIPLVAVEYPARNAQPLRDLFAGADNVVVVDNEQTFLQASTERPLNEIYLDLFAGILGHMTAVGHRLLATNVADAIESIGGLRS